ncbi:MAG: hypothetical protein H7Y11_10280, partial [Armatimonadetes bacterium]|nr:hypothetical protein [Anaerolineae bacterium]
IPRVTYVKLEPGTQLAKEWFLVSYGKDYFSALATEEQTHITDADEDRRFNGAWTFDVELVTILHDWLSSAVKAPPLVIADSERNYPSQIKLMGNTMGRMVGRMDKERNANISGEMSKAMQGAFGQ